MLEHNSVEVDTAVSHITDRPANTRRMKAGQLWRSCIKWVVQDWRTHKYVFFALLLLVLTIIPTVLYYLNYPWPELNADTPAYIHVVETLRKQPFMLVDTWRLPVYPLFVILMYAMAGQDNLLAVSIAQAVLFVLATLEIYVLAILLLKRAWMAFLLGMLVGTNLVLLGYIKPIMTEGLALWLLTTMTLALVCFIRTMRLRAFWLSIVCMVFLIFTRPEWLYLPLLLFAYLLLVAIHRRNGRRVLGHLVGALALIGTLAGSYIAVNAAVNHYPGMTAIENYNWMGKVLQYNMWDEASPQYAHARQELDYYVALIDNDPYHILSYIPEFARDNFSPAGQYARDIIIHHPGEFLLKSVPLVFASLTAYFDPFQADLAGPFGGPLSLLKSIHQALYNMNALFPICVLLWVALLCWRRTRSQQIVLEMGAVILLVVYALLITTLGGYRLDDYMRVHIVFDPLLILSTWGSLCIGSVFVVQRVSRRTMRR